VEKHHAASQAGAEAESAQALTSRTAVNNQDKHNRACEVERISRASKHKVGGLVREHRAKGPRVVLKVEDAAEQGELANVEVSLRHSRMALALVRSRAERGRPAEANKGMRTRANLNLKQSRKFLSLGPIKKIKEIQCAGKHRRAHNLSPHNRAFGPKART
jgi:hypothetical protein